MVKQILKKSLKKRVKKQLEDVGSEADEIRSDDGAFFRYFRKSDLDEDRAFLGRRRRYEDSSSDDEDKKRHGKRGRTSSKFGAAANRNQKYVDHKKGATGSVSSSRKDSPRIYPQNLKIGNGKDKKQDSGISLGVTLKCFKCGGPHILKNVLKSKIVLISRNFCKSSEGGTYEIFI